MISLERVSCVAIMLTACLAVAGCGSSPNYRYFTLEAASVEGRAKPSEKLSVTVGPVSLADHLERREIVSRGPDGEILVSNSERWAGGLERNIADTIATSLSRSSGSSDVISYYANFQAGTRYAVVLHISEFELVSAGFVHLRANWSITDTEASSSQLHSHEFEFPVSSTSIEDRIVAKNQAISLLSEAILNSIEK